MTRVAGFSLVELVIAMGIMAGVSAAVFAMIEPAHGAFSVEPQAADMQQRLRVASDSLARDLLMAGAGSYAGSLRGPLDHYFAPVLPFRRGLSNADAPGTFRADTITVLYVGTTAAQTTTAETLTSSSRTFSVNQGPACPLDSSRELQPSCGLLPNDTVLVFDKAGNADAFTLAGVLGASGTMEVNAPAGGTPSTYAAGSKMVKARVRTYFLKRDPTGAFSQLAYYDDGSNGDIPVVDHVVRLQFDYFGDPQPPLLLRPTCDPMVAAPCASYGPDPPPLGVQTTSYPAGENCTFKVDAATGLQVPRLEVLGGDPTAAAPIALAAAQFTDGPWCPDATNAGRFDADLLRIRKIGVTIRVEAAGGSARDASRALADQEIRFEVAPRNLNLNR